MRRAPRGQAFSWEVAQTLAEYDPVAALARTAPAPRTPFLLAGGLTPDNVHAALRASQAVGADTSSGVETDGAKDLAKIRAYVAQARLPF